MMNHTDRYLLYDFIDHMIWNKKSIGVIKICVTHGSSLSRNMAGEMA